jgi:hypothetical protein
VSLRVERGRARHERDGRSGHGPGAVVLAAALGLLLLVGPGSRSVEAAPPEPPKTPATPKRPRPPKTPRPGKPSTARADAGAPRRGAKIVRPESAREGRRDLAATAAVFRGLVEGQPWGRSWRELVPTDPAPKDTKGLGEAKTHAALKHDEIEMQAQVQYLHETGVESRYGFVSVRGVRVFRYGQLAGLRLVLDRIGRVPAEDARFAADLAALVAAWADPARALGVDRAHLVTQNDLAPLAPGSAPAAAPKLPLVIELQPKAAPERD